jgi:hypothetical protein
MNKLNPYYLYLQANLSLLGDCFQVLEPEENTDTIKTCLLFMTIDRIASRISPEYGAREEVIYACKNLNYGDINLLSAWILEDIKRK